MNPEPVTRAVRTAVRIAVEEAMRSGVSRVVLAVSGGLDSMVLLDSAAAIAPEQCIVGTFDHGTGPAAKRAIRLVKRRAAELGIECVAGSSIGALVNEAEFRTARWEFLREIAARFDSGIVATAHTEDDQIETVLYRVMRGAGTRGFAGLYARSDVLRPLLSFRRHQLESYAASNRVEWIEDPSNATLRFARNRIRHEILPALRHAVPTIDNDLLAVARDAANWRDDVEAFIDRLNVRVLSGNAGLDVGTSAVAHLSSTELAAIWPAIAARVGLTLDRRGIVRLSEFSLRSRIGARIPLSGGWQVVRSRTAFQLRRVADESEPGVISATGGSWGEWLFQPVATDNGIEVSNVWTAWLPIDQPLLVRRWEPGDTLESSQFSSKAQLVKRLLSKAGITGHQRMCWPVVLAGEKIVWIPGVGRSDAATARSGRPGLPFVCEHHSA